MPASDRRRRWRAPAIEASLAGIDVSHFQGEVDWGAVAATGVRFAFIKATEGLDDVDPRFAQNWQGSRAAGLLRGAYHFLHPNLDAGQQAAHFLSVVTLDDDALPPALDVEVTNGVAPAALATCIETWLGAVQAATRLQARGLYRSLVLARQCRRRPRRLPALARLLRGAAGDAAVAGSAGPSGSIRRAAACTGIAGPVDLDFCSAERRAACARCARA